MYKNLAPHTLGLFCSQNELIELTLTHKFKGLEIDFADFQAQIQERGFDQASRFLKSAPVKISTQLPIEWWTDDATYNAAIEGLAESIQPAKELGCTFLTTNVRPGCTQRPYHENFEIHRQRLTEIATALEAFEMRLGIGFEIPLDVEYPYSFITEPEALVTLFKMCDSENLGLVVDTWHWTAGGGSFELLSSLGSKQVVDVRLADLPAEWNPNRLQASDRLVYGSTGVVKGAQLHQILTDIGYRGPVTSYSDASHFSGVNREAAVRSAGEMIDTFLAGTTDSDLSATASAEPV